MVSAINQQCFLFIYNLSAKQSFLLEFYRLLSMLFDIRVFSIFMLCYYLLYGFVQDVHHRFLITRNFITYCLLVVVLFALKYTLNVQRPFCSLEVYSILDITKERCNSSFPSAHAAFAFFTVLLFWERVNKLLKFALLAMLLLTCTARIGLAMHFPIDLMGGVLISFAVYRFASRYLTKEMLLWDRFTK